MNLGVHTLVLDGLNRAVEFDLEVVQPEHVGAPHVDPLGQCGLENNHRHGRLVGQGHALEEAARGVQSAAGVEHQLLVLFGRHDAPTEFPVQYEYLVAAAPDHVGRAEGAGDAGELDGRFHDDLERVAKTLFGLVHELVIGRECGFALVVPKVAVHGEGPASVFLGLECKG